MADRICWKCEKHSHMTRVGHAYPIAQRRDRAEGARIAGFYTCDNCKWPSIAIGGIVSERLKAQQSNYQHQINVSHDEASFTWHPGSAEGKEFADVPEHIAAAADEAYRCRSFQAFRAAILLTRSVIEATCKEKGITTGRLVDKIDKMREQEFIREDTKDAAHEVRFLGNDMAHGDFVEPVDEEDAEMMLELMSEVLDEVFQGPARVRRARAKRQGRGSK